MSSWTPSEIKHALTNVIATALVDTDHYELDMATGRLEVRVVEYGEEDAIVRAKEHWRDRYDEVEGIDELIENAVKLAVAEREAKGRQ